MTHNKKQTIPTAIPVEELADRMSITPYKLRLAIGRAAAAAYTIDIGLGIKVKLQIVDEANLSDDASLELIHYGILDDEPLDDETLDERQPRRICLAAPAASEQHQSLLAAPPASARIQ